MKAELDEKNLVKKIINKDEKALRFLFTTYHRHIFNFIRRQIQSYHLSEEITQDVFLDFIEALRDFQYQCSLKTFLFSIARNKVIDTIRKKKLKKILFSALPPQFVEGLKAVFIDEEIEKKELAQKIRKVLDVLPNDYRMVLRLKYVEGERVKHIAREISLGFKATESLIFRARKAFIKIFKAMP